MWKIIYCKTVYQDKMILQLRSLVTVMNLHYIKKFLQAFITFLYVV